MIEVTLQGYELVQASSVGAMRQIASLRRGLRDQHGFDGLDGWTAHIEGACGELAVAKALGLYWDGAVGRFRQPGGDVLGLEVRRRKRHDWDLLVRPGDSDTAVFVHVTGCAPTYRVVGCLPGKACKLPAYLATHAGRPPAYFVPAAALWPPSEALVYV